MARETVAAGLVPPRRVALATAALAAFEAAHPGLPGPCRDTAADLAVQAGDTARAGGLLAESGAAALTRGALATAVDTLRRAAALLSQSAGVSPAEAIAVENRLVEALAGRVDEAMTAGAGLIARLGRRPGPRVTWYDRCAARARGRTIPVPDHHGPEVTAMTTIAVKNLDTPDQKHGFENGDLNLVSPPGMTIARAVFQPGWRWSIDVKPAAGTDSCPAAHTGYVISGRFAVRMDDGTEAEFGPGDAHVVSPGHDAWVVGTEPCVIIDVAPAPQQQPGTAGSDGARMALCPCGIEFRAARADQVDELVAAVQQHASGSHGHDVSREHILAELVPA